MARSFWDRTFDAISDHSKMYFGILVGANFLLVVISIVLFFVFGSVRVTDDAGNTITVGDGLKEISRGNLYSTITILLISISQIVLGVHCVGPGLT